MALPAHVLVRLPARLRQNGLLRTGDQLLGAQALGPRLAQPREAARQPEGTPGALDPWAEMLLSGDWPEGVVSELSLAGGWAGGTSLGLNACRHVQETGALFS